MKRYTLEYRIKESKDYSVWIEVPVTPEGHYFTSEMEIAEMAKAHWECEIMSGTFRIMTWEATGAK